MKKKLLHLAVIAAVSAAPLSAMAEATVYGKVHLSVDTFSGMMDADQDSTDGAANDGTADDVSMFVSSNSSRLGVKGSVDAGDGLKAIYKMEWTVGVDAGGAPAGSRNAYGGLSGGFGTVMAGYHDNPVKLVGRKMDLFGDTVADSRALITEDWTDDRLGSFLGYMNKFGGVDLMLGYLVQDDAGDSFGGVAGSVGIPAGPVNVAIGFQSGGFSYFDGGGTADYSNTAFRIGVQGKFGPVDGRLLYQSISTEDDSSAGVTTEYGRTVLGLGAGIGVGPSGKVKVQYYMASAEDDAVVDDGATQISLGYDHKLGDKVKVYGVYTQVSNDDAGTYRVAGGGHGAKKQIQMDPTEDSNSAISVGVVYSF